MRSEKIDRLNQAGLTHSHNNPGTCARAGAAKRDASGLQIGSPEHDLLRLLEEAGFPRPLKVEPVEGTSLGGRNIPWQAFQRRRETGGGRPAANGAGYGFCIEFAEAVQGPVAVGYAAHFGMGGFEVGGKY